MGLTPGGWTKHSRVIHPRGVAQRASRSGIDKRDGWPKLMLKMRATHKTRRTHEPNSLTPTGRYASWRRRASSPFRGRLDVGHDDLPHGQHGLGDSGSELRVRIGLQTGQLCRDDLPGDAESVLEPAALTGLTTVDDERVPQPVDLVLAAVDRHR